MAGSFTNEFENRSLDWVYGGSTPTRPTSRHLALYSADPSGETGTGGTELTGNNYSRQTITFTAASGGSTNNNANVDFSPSGGDWLDVTAGQVMDASSGGNAISYDLALSITGITDGDTVRFPITTGIVATMD